MVYTYLALENAAEFRNVSAAAVIGLISSGSNLLHRRHCHAEKDKNIHRK